MLFTNLHGFQFPIKPERQLGLTIYHLAHACSFPVVNDLYGISKSVSTKTF